MTSGKRLRVAFVAVCGILSVSLNAGAVTLEELAEKVEQLSRENAELRRQVRELRENRKTGAVVREDLAAAPVPKQSREDSGALRVNHRLSYDLLDPTTAINRKQLYLLEHKRAEGRQGSRVYLGGAVTAIADYQRSNTESKFGYLMRHPTAANQRTKTVSEAVIHSSQVQLTANLGDWVTAHMQLLYNPEQSFGSGTITDINRNQVQVRRGYVLFGNLDESPYYLSLGKMAVPFGLTDTLNPFTASTVWHAFGGLAYGVQGGYYENGLSLRLMGVQGGAQFRAANVPVDGSNVPSKLNNFAVDASFETPLGDGTANLLAGASYIRGSAYCQAYPITHFTSCDEENGAYGVYGRLGLNAWLFQAEFIRTEDEWPGTFNPAIPQFDASRVTSWDIGGRYSTTFGDYPADISLDFSRFEAGPDGAPWEFQDQIVLGASLFVWPTVKLFGELIRTEGYAPLNFLTGGNLPPGQTHSDRDSVSNVILLGGNLAF